MANEINMTAAEYRLDEIHDLTARLSQGLGDRKENMANARASLAAIAALIGAYPQALARVDEAAAALTAGHYDAVEALCQAAIQARMC